MQIHPLCNISKIAFDASLLSFTAFRQYIYIGFNALYHFKNTTFVIIVDPCARYIQALQAIIFRYIQTPTPFYLPMEK